MELNFKTSPVTVCVPGHGRMLFAKVQDGKFIQYHMFDMGRNSLDLTDVFQQAKQAGYKGRMALAAAFSDFRIAKERLPDMTEEEVRGTMYWNSDRLFRLDKEMASDFRVVSHNLEGYELLAAGVGLDTVTLFSEAARSSGSRIAWVVPLPMLFESDKVIIVGLAGRREAWLYFWDGQGWANHQRVPKNEAKERTASFSAAADGAGILWFPTMDCDEESFAMWTSLDGMDESLSFSQVMLTMAGKTAGGIKGLNLALEEDKPEPLFSKQNRMLRLLQGLTMAAGLLTAVFGVQYLMAFQERDAAQEAASRLAADREAMKTEKVIEKIRQDRRKEEQQIFADDWQWEQKLVVLADGLPSGIALQSIERSGSSILIKGTADQSASVLLLQKRIKGDWHWNAMIESDKKDPRLPFRRFTLRCIEKRNAP